MMEKYRWTGRQRRRQTDVENRKMERERDIERQMDIQAERGMDRQT